MPARHRPIELAGPNREPQPDRRMPPWQGHPPGTAWRIISPWIVVALGAFHLLNARLPEDDGFGGFVPLWFAVTMGIAGVSVTERAMLRRE